MKVKKYTAASPAQAMQAIRAELGDDAVILHSKRVVRRSWLGLAKQPAYEVTAAVDAVEEEVAHPVSQLPALGAPVSPAGWPDERLQGAELEDIKESIREMREAIGQLGRGKGKNGKQSGGEASPELARLSHRLVSQGIEEPLSQEIVKQVQFELSRDACQDWGIVVEAAMRQLERRFATIDPVGSAGPMDGARPLVVAVVGPTGVGKSTTVAKLAANLAAQQGHSVAIATADTIRIGAIPQMEAYAEIFGIPFAVVYTPADLAEMARQRTGRDIILLDTPGWSPRRADRFPLAEFVKAVDRCVVLLTISAHERSELALRARQGMDGSPVHGMIITKLDEASSYGSTFNLTQRLALPAAYVAKGQRVPDDIEPANARAMALRILGDGK